MVEDRDEDREDEEEEGDVDEAASCRTMACCRSTSVSSRTRSSLSQPM